MGNGGWVYRVQGLFILVANFRKPILAKGFSVECSIRNNRMAGIAWEQRGEEEGSEMSTDSLIPTLSHPVAEIILNCFQGLERASWGRGTSTRMPKNFETDSFLI